MCSKSCVGRKRLIHTHDLDEPCGETVLKEISVNREHIFKHSFCIAHEVVKKISVK